MAASQVDSSEDAVAVREFAAAIISRVCSLCGNRAVARPGEIASVFNCPVCGTTTCLGCGHKVADEGIIDGIATEITWHCDSGRLAVCWALLCAYDEEVGSNKQATVRQATSPRRTRSRKPRRLGIKGVGYGLDDHGLDDAGISISEDEDGGMSIHSLHAGPNPAIAGLNPAIMAKKAPARVDPDDEPTTRVMTALLPLLPSTKSFGPIEFDIDTPPVLASLLFCSSLLDKAAELLRNTSLEDATQRYGLYHSLLEFMQALAKSESNVTARVLHSQRPLNKAGHHLGRVSYGLPTRLKNEPSEHAASLVACMTSLSEQTEMLLKMKSVDGYYDDFAADDGPHMIILCTEVRDCAALLASTKNFLQSNDSHPSSPPVNPHAWQKDIAVLSVPDDEIFKVHYYAKEAAEMNQVQPRRMRHLINGITTLKTGLPPNIFVRYGESRLDVMKVVIAGPEGTPYENEYPQVPPKMNFRTTGAGTIRFNPNLYQDGKVCLSLLNTWSRNQWEPKQSTLLQVLVSIQAMVLCADPFCNEPADTGKEGTEQSKDYNRRLYPDVLKYGMLEWIDGKKSFAPPTKRDPSGLPVVRQGPPSTESMAQPHLFSDVVKKHFDTNRDQIIKTIQDWVKDKQARDAKLREKPPPKKKTKTVAHQTHPTPSQIVGGTQGFQNVATLGPFSHTASTALGDPGPYGGYVMSEKQKTSVPPPLEEKWVLSIPQPSPYPDMQSAPLLPFPVHPPFSPSVTQQYPTYHPGGLPPPPMHTSNPYHSTPSGPNLSQPKYKHSLHPAPSSWLPAGSISNPSFPGANQVFWNQLPPGAHQQYLSSQEHPSKQSHLSHAHPGHVNPGHAHPGHANPGHAHPGHVHPGYTHPHPPKYSYASNIPLHLQSVGPGNSQTGQSFNYVPSNSNLFGPPLQAGQTYNFPPSAPATSFFEPSWQSMDIKSMDIATPPSLAHLQKKSEITSNNNKIEVNDNVKRDPIEPDAPLREHLLRAVEDLGGKKALGRDLSGWWDQFGAVGETLDAVDEALDADLGIWGTLSP